MFKPHLKWEVELGFLPHLAEQTQGSEVAFQVQVFNPSQITLSQTQQKSHNPGDCLDTHTPTHTHTHADTVRELFISGSRDTPA